MLFDDDINVLTTFELNRMASFTFGDVICGEIFDVLEYTLRNPLEFTVLSLHKTLVLLHHLAIYASQKAANQVWILRPLIKPFLEYNTVLLMAAEQPSSIMARMQKIKGGAVDKGQPVREAAKILWGLLLDVESFKQVRETHADPDSLVPVGNHDQVGYVSDEVRKATLEEKIRKENEVKIKSNLQDGGSGGFGSGANTVVGAAHSIEEMLKMAMKNKSSYRDGDMTEEEKAHLEHLRQLEQEVRERRFTESNQNNTADNKSATVDLLDIGHDHGPIPPLKESKSADSLPYKDANNDPFSFGMVGGDSSHDRTSAAVHGNVSAMHHDPFDILSAPAPSSSNSSKETFGHAPSKPDELDLLSLSMGDMGLNNHQPAVFDTTTNDVTIASQTFVPHSDNHIPPMPSWEPPTPPKDKTPVIPLDVLYTESASSLPLAHAPADSYTSPQITSPSVEFHGMGMGGYHDMNATNMASMNPMTMQTAMQNMTLEQQQQMMKQMMMMNQQLMAQLTKMQNQQYYSDENGGLGNASRREHPGHNEL